MTNTDNVFDVTLDDDIWKDSFDRLLNKRSLLRELNLLKPNVRISFNNDSSVEVSKENISYTEKPDNKILGKRTSGSISTPKFINKAVGPFDCHLSPITSWRLTNAYQKDSWDPSCKLKSTILDRVTESIEETTPSPPKNVARSIPVIELSEHNETDIKTEPVLEKNSTSDLQCDENRFLNVILPPGKWRRSLTVWKRQNHPKHEYLDSFASNSTNCFTLNIRNSRKTSFVHRKTTSIISPKRKSELELLKICKQSEHLPFSSLYSKNVLPKCKKIGEGTYGEVFANTDNNNEKTVIKIIPIEGEISVNGEPQKTFETILPEVLITSELSKLRNTKSFATTGFVFLKNVRSFRGKYPDHLIELWELYEKNNGSENDHPEVFKNDQLYVSLEIAYGGKDLEGYVFRNSEQAYSIFLQVAFSMAAAEKALEFEHRDLHVGNILIQTTNEKTVEFTLNKKTINIPTNGVKATIIDYTLSRILLNRNSFYNDLSADDELFCAKGDYQYDIYRLMKEKLNNNWQMYDPQTNVMWLHYLLTKLVDSVKYKNYRSKQHKINLDRLKTLRDSIMNCNSAYEFSINIQV
ncbi:serine/threonine-protein kinase haspin homolog [Eupeodes corollae]|uniref:serine/threonine-protein kinase haspin homolog n=1 Tax=Eupeodes corollae TaxID=290404 RepID=UPI002490E0BA|nr:serine/threonine-protein kinase haspin homolog [Eupeodes corollae]